MFLTFILRLFPICGESSSHLDPGGHCGRLRMDCALWSMLYHAQALPCQIHHDLRQTETRKRVVPNDRNILIAVTFLFLIIPSYKYSFFVAFQKTGVLRVSYTMCSYRLSILSAPSSDTPLWIFWRTSKSFRKARR